MENYSKLTVEKNYSLNCSMFVLLVSILPLADLLNGYFIFNAINIPLGVIYRLGFITFLIVSILLKNIDESVFTVITVFFLIVNSTLIVVQSIILLNPSEWIIEDFSILSKYFLWILITYYLYQRRYYFQKIKFENIFIIISLFFTLGLLIPYLIGQGTNTYTSGVGFKGYFFAQNDITLSFIISLVFTAKVLLKHLEKKWNLYVMFLSILYIGNIISLVLIGTKTALLCGVVVSLYLIYRVFFKTSYQTVIHRIFIWLSIAVMALWFFYRGLGYTITALDGVLKRFEYFYGKYDGNIIRIITSQRLEFLKGGTEKFLSDPNSNLVLLFGQGFEYRMKTFGRLGLIEMDFFDVLFSLGIIGFVANLILIVFFLTMCLKNRLNTVYEKLFIVILFYSFFAGHTFFSAMCSTLLGLVCGGIIIFHNKDISIKK
ncbi:O-antigen ligase family protein [Enterococcus gilvus]|uniref:O-antigen ligase family protein n=1 Tax=Enterococcus gilvus TaxID=160453 RepID=UPI0028D01449|nr:O-antigen ligase family protein [Enterococcus gilvus]